MSPEQRLGQPVDERSDIYALGQVLYKILTGSLAEGFNLPSHRRDDISLLWDDVVKKALRHEPNERYATMDEFRQAVTSISLGNASTSLPNIRYAKSLALVAVSTFAVIGYFLWHTSRHSPAHEEENGTEVEQSSTLPVEEPEIASTTKVDVANAKSPPSTTKTQEQEDGPAPKGLVKGISDDDKQLSSVIESQVLESEEVSNRSPDGGKQPALESEEDEKNIVDLMLSGRLSSAEFKANKQEIIRVLQQHKWYRVIVPTPWKMTSYMVLDSTKMRFMEFETTGMRTKGTATVKVERRPEFKSPEQIVVFLFKKQDQDIQSGPSHWKSMTWDEPIYRRFGNTRYLIQHGQEISLHDFMFGRHLSIRFENTEWKISLVSSIVCVPRCHYPENVFGRREESLA